MKKYILPILLLAIASAGYSQGPKLDYETKDITPPRTISVTGTAEKLFEADRLYVTLGYGEYWKEEFEEGKEWNDFRTKVPIENVEPKIIKALKDLGFSDKDIVVQQIGNNYRQQGKDFLIKKTLELKIEDLAMMNKIVSIMDMRGIDRMNVSRMEIDDIEDRKLEVKIEALKAAWYKAEKMVEALDEDLGKVLHISETGNTINNYKMANRMFVANELMEEDAAYESPLDNFRKMKLKYSVSVIYSIK